MVADITFPTASDRLATKPPFSHQALATFEGVLATSGVTRRNNATAAVTLTGSSGLFLYTVAFSSPANQGADLLVAAYDSNDVLIGWQVVNRATNFSASYNGSFNFAAAGLNRTETTGIRLRAWQGTAGTGYGSASDTPPATTYGNTANISAGDATGFVVNSTVAPTASSGAVNLSSDSLTSGSAQSTLLTAVTVDTTPPATTATITAVNDDNGVSTVVVANGGRTDDTSLSLGGTLSAPLLSGEKVVIFSGTTRLAGQATVSGSTWTYTDLRTLNTTTYLYTARVADSNDNLGAASDVYSVTVDTTAPSLPVIALGSGVSLGATEAEATQATGVITVNAEVGSTISVTFTGSSTVPLVKSIPASSTSPAQPQPVVLTASEVASLGSGTVAVDATARDVAGNISGVRSSSFVLDLDPPAPTITSIGGPDSNVTTAVGDSSVVGTGDIGRTVTLLFGSTVLGTVVPDPTTGVFTYNLSAANRTTIGDGTGKQITVRQTDVAGNTGTSAPFTFSVNVVVPPAPTVVSTALTSSQGMQDGWLNAGDQVTATVTMSEAVTVSGVPCLRLDIGGSLVLANYSSGSGSTDLTFVYTILAGDNDSAGIRIRSLFLNGGTITGSAGQSASLGFSVGPRDPAFKVDTTAPLFTSGATAAVDENISASSVYTATTTDLAPVTYSLKPATGDVASFSINASSGSVSILASPDYETQASYAFTVVATDAAGNSSEQPVTLAINDLVEYPVTAPTDSNAAPNSVAERSAVGTPVGLTALATDADPSDTVSYSLVNDDSGTTPYTGGDFAIAADTGVVSVAGTIDYEDGATRTVYVKATSTDGSTAVASFTIDITDVFSLQESAGVVSFTGSATGPISISIDSTGTASFSRAGTPARDSVLSLSSKQLHVSAGTELLVSVTGTSADDLFMIDAPNAAAVSFSGDAAGGVDEFAIRHHDGVTGLDVRSLRFDTSGVSNGEIASFIFDTSAANTSNPFDNDVLQLVSGSKILSTSGFSTLKVRTGSVDVSQATVSAGITYDIQSNITLTAAQFMASHAFLSADSSGSILVRSADADDLNRLTSFLSDAPAGFTHGNVIAFS